MRAYIKNDLSNEPKTFILTDIWFADKDADINQYPPKGYMCVSGLSCETEKGRNDCYNTLWRGVSVDTEEVYDKEVYSIDELMELLKDKIVVDVSAHLDDKYLSDEECMYNTVFDHIAFRDYEKEIELNEWQYNYKTFVIND